MASTTDAGSELIGERVEAPPEREQLLSEAAMTSM